MSDSTGSPDRSELDTEPALYLSELQSSCDTYMSQRSVEGNNQEEQSQYNETCENFEVAEIDKSGVGSSMEVEGNLSLDNISVCLPEGGEIPEVKDGGHSQDDILEESAQTCEGSPKGLRKRKAETDSSPLTLKKFRKDSPNRSVAPEDQHAIEIVPDSPDQKQSSGMVVDISSTSEKTIDLEGSSQEFSLRIEDTSPPSHPSDEKCQEGSSWKSHSVEKLVTPEQGGLSQRSLVSWSSHEQSLSWSSHKDQDEKLQVSKNENEEQNKDVLNQKNYSMSPLPDCKAKQTDSDSSSKRQQVMEERLLHSSILWTIEDNKLISGEIKQVSLLEEPPGNEKPGRMSIMSSSSYKSSSSSGSVGLPGPFPLPGNTRLSVMSSISSSTSSSMERSYNRPGWDGPFLKPPVRDSTKPILVCGHCHSAYPPFEKTSSPVVNGSPKLPKIEELVSEKSPSRRKIRGKGSLSSQAQSSGTLEEETSNSESQPQAASTPTPAKRRRPRKRTDTLKKEFSTPVKSIKLGSPGRTPMPDRTLALPITPTPPQSRHLGKGEAVLAKWAGDGRYYPGWAKLSDSSTQTLVHFCDGNRKVMSSTWVVRANIITAGTLLLVTVDSTSLEYEECLVVQVNMEGPEPVYQVERDNESREVQFSNIALLEAQVLELTMAVVQKTPATLNFNDVSLENIVSHPRKRSARTPFGEAASPGSKRKKRQITPEPSTSNGQTFGGPDNVYLDTDSSTHSSCSLDLRGREVKPLDVECSPPEVEEQSRHKLSHYRRNKTSKSKGKIEEDEPEHLVKMMGPIPEVGSELFTDCVFLITYTTQVGLKLALDAGTSCFEGKFEDASGNESGMPVWKERLRTQIKNGGGKVYTTFSQVTKDEMPNTYLITDKPCNTPLYLQCLVNSVPIYSTSVIQKCCSQNRPFKELIGLRTTKKLSAGYSLSRQCLVNPRSSQPLRGKTLLLALSGEPTLSTFWDNIIRKIGGTCEVFRGRCLIENRFDVIVTDSDCDRQLVSQACEQKVPLVSLIWLQQCIINGDFRSPTEHSLFKYNSSEGHDSPEY